MNIPKTCATCAHKSFQTCRKTGFYIGTQRKYPTGGCDEGFSGWTLRLGLIERVKFWWRGKP